LDGEPEFRRHWARRYRTLALPGLSTADNASMITWSTEPPSYRKPIANFPTLLFSWWCVCFSAVVIIVRLAGRKIRSNVLFREDWIMLLALIPLFARMAFIHVVLLWDTNNVQVAGQHLTPTEIYHRSMGSKLVLPARIFYAMYIWTCKLTVSEFLKRITIRIWRRSYEITLQGIRIFLFVTFIAVVISTIGGCQPFHDYWQVVPEASPACRDGYANLVTMGTCDILTDILLIAFPIPIVLRSGQTWKRKFQLSSLFSLSLIMIAITATRVPEVIAHLGRQQYRSVWASCEILAATGVSNAVILGSFLRDKGTKRNKYRTGSMTDSTDRTSSRRPTVAALNRGSEEELFRAMGMRVPKHLEDDVEKSPRLAPMALPAKAMIRRDSGTLPDLAKLNLDYQQKEAHEDVEDSMRIQKAPFPVSPTTRQMSFFDVGGLLEDLQHSSDSQSHSTTLVDSAASNTTTAYDFAPTPEQSRRGSHAFLQDIGGLLTPTSSRNNHSNGIGPSRRHSDALIPLHRPRNAPVGVLGPTIERQEPPNSILQDVGGLLGRPEPAAWMPSVSSPEINRKSRHKAGRSTSQHSLQDIGGLLSE